MTVIGRAQQQGGGVDRAGRDDDDAGGEAFGKLFPLIIGAFDFDFRHRVAGGIGLQAADIGAGEQRDIGVFERRTDAENVGIGLGVDQAGKAVKGIAAYAGAEGSGAAMPVFVQ